MVAAAYACIYLLVFAAGASVFSFVNVVVYRLPCGISVCRSRSRCPVCGHELRPFDMIPVLNRIYLGGKCRYCKAEIPVRYQITELCGGAAAVLCFVRFDAFGAVTAFAAIAVLACAALIDTDTMEIPDRLHVALAAVALISWAAFPEVGIKERIIGAFIISVPMLAVALAVPNGFGGGDIKLMAPAGFLLGWRCALCAFFIAVLIGGAQGAFLLITKKRAGNGQFAFAPALCIGICAALIWGSGIIDWYLSLLR